MKINGFILDFTIFILYIFINKAFAEFKTNVKFGNQNTAFGFSWSGSSKLGIFHSYFTFSQGDHPFYGDCPLKSVNYF